MMLFLVQASQELLSLSLSLSIAGQASPVRYAKFQSMRYFIDNDIIQNGLIDIDIFKIVLIDIDIDISQKCRYIDNQYFI